jgi:RNA polymerase sigma factor (sigma-70 family)
VPIDPMSTMLHRLRKAALLAGGAKLADAELLRRFVGGRDQAALELLVRRHGPMVWGVCCRVLAVRQDAEDAFQATFLVLLRRAGSIRSGELLANWLYGVARQTALKARATARRRGARERQVVVMPERETGRQRPPEDLLLFLEEELGRLPEKYRTALVLCDLEGMTRQEACRHLGCPEGTVASRLVRARALLALRLRRRGLVVSAGALAATLARETASAGVPAALLTCTIKAVSLIAAGKTVDFGVCSAQAATLTEGVLKTMFRTKIRSALVMLGLLAPAALGTVSSASYLLPAWGEQPPRSSAKVPQNARRPSPGPVKPRTDTDKLQGTWVVLQTRSDGENRPVPESIDARLVIDGDEFRLAFFTRPTKFEGNSMSGSLLLATFKLNAKTSPQNLDLILSKDPDAHELCLGIYQLDGDDLTICLPREKPWERRPTRFTAEKGSGREIYVLRRARTEKK